MRLRCDAARSLAAFVDIRGHILADLVEAALAGADCVDGAEGDNAAKRREDTVTPGLEP